MTEDVVIQRQDGNRPGRSGSQISPGATTNSSTSAGTDAADIAAANADGRINYDAGQDWLIALITSITSPAQWSRPTPCSEFSVRELVQHLIATLDRARVIAEGGDPNPMPRAVEAPMPSCCRSSPPEFLRCERRGAMRRWHRA